MKKTLLAALFLSLSTLAMAAVLTFSWTAPTQNTDNSTIPASGAGSIVDYVVTYGPCNAGRTDLTSITGTIIRTTVSGVSPDLPPGTWCGYVQARNTYGNVSAPSNVAFKVIPAPTPKPPENFSFGS